MESTRIRRLAGTCKVRVCGLRREPDRVSDQETLRKCRSLARCSVSLQEEGEYIQVRSSVAYLPPIKRPLTATTKRGDITTASSSTSSCPSWRREEKTGESDNSLLYKHGAATESDCRRDKERRYNCKCCVLPRGGPFPRCTSTYHEAYYGCHLASTPKVGKSVPCMWLGWEQIQSAGGAKPGAVSVDVLQLIPSSTILTDLLNPYRLMYKSCSIGRGTSTGTCASCTGGCAWC